MSIQFLLKFGLNDMCAHAETERLAVLGSLQHAQQPHVRATLSSTNPPIVLTTTSSRRRCSNACLASFVPTMKLLQKLGDLKSLGGTHGRELAKFTKESFAETLQATWCSSKHTSMMDFSAFEKCTQFESVLKIIVCGIAGALLPTWQVSQNE